MPISKQASGISGILEQKEWYLVANLKMMRTRVQFAITKLKANTTDYQELVETEPAQ